MKKTKHNPPAKKIPEPNFIKFSKVQTNYLREVRFRQQQEFGEALEAIYEELGFLEKALAAAPGTLQLRQDLSGVDILPVVKVEVEEKEEPEKPATQEEIESTEELAKKNAH